MTPMLSDNMLGSLWVHHGMVGVLCTSPKANITSCDDDGAPGSTFAEILIYATRRYSHTLSHCVYSYPITEHCYVTRARSKVLEYREC
jgi:hypothetical protein